MNYLSSNYLGQQIVYALVIIAMQLCVLISIYQTFMGITLENRIIFFVGGCYMQTHIIFSSKIQMLAYEPRHLVIVELFGSKTYPVTDFRYIKPYATDTYKKKLNIYRIGFVDGKEYLVIPSKGRHRWFSDCTLKHAKEMESEINSLHL